MGEAIEVAIDFVTARKTMYKNSGIKYYQPWIFMITDGAPNEHSPWRQAAERVKREVASKRLTFFGVGVDDADMQVIKQISPDRFMKLDGLEFRTLFIWLSQSCSRVAGSRLGNQVPLPPVPSFNSPD